MSDCKAQHIDHADGATTDAFAQLTRARTMIREALEIIDLYPEAGLSGPKLSHALDALENVLSDLGS